MRILLLLRSLRLGGAERQAILLASSLSAHGHDVAIVTFYPGGKLVAEAQSKAVDVFCMQKNGRWDIVEFAYRLARFVRRMEPDVLYGFNDAANLLTICLRPVSPGCKTVWGIRNDLRRPGRGHVGRVLRTISPYLSLFAHVLIANSRAGLANAVIWRSGTTRAFVVSNAVDHEFFSPSVEQRNRVREMLGIVPDEKLLGSVGHIRKSKGTNDLVVAFSQLAQSHPGWKLLLVGDDGVLGESSQSVLQAARLQHRVIVLEERSEINAVFNAIDLLCSASCSEGFPNVIAEAMACGKPCVVSDAGESAMVLGDHGLVFPSGEKGALRQALDSAMNDAARFGKPEDIRQSIVTRFSQASMASQTEYILTRLAP
jgi:glycosyltransferase involved in cell wall biosynthesis